MTTTRRPYGKQNGFSMVELMVAITIGLIILAAVSTIFVSSKSTYNTQDNLARLQENARFAMQFIMRDLRMAGYYGCNDDMTRINSTVNGALFSLANPIEGMDETSGTWSPSGDPTLPTDMKAATDAVIFRMADSVTNINLATPMPNESAVLFTDSITGLNVGDIIMLSDCASSNVMQITGFVGGNGIQHNAGAGTPGNSTQMLDKTYAPPAAIRKFQARRYYVAQNAGDKLPTLYRDDNAGPQQPLVEGVTNLQILFGKDTDGTPDGVPNIYVSAGFDGGGDSAAALQSAADWARVKSVRITMTVAAPEDTATTREFTATTQLRNM